MSTKTTFKRIALVAVAALGFGTLSVAPSSAFVQQWTVAQVSGSTSVAPNTAASGVFNFSFAASANGDISIAGANLLSSPVTSGKTAAALSFSGAPITGYTNSNVTLGDENAGAGSSAIWYKDNAGNNNWAGFTQGIQIKGDSAGRTSVYTTLTFTPDVAGTYVIRVYGAPNATTTAIFTDWTITAVAPVTASATAFINTTTGSAPTADTASASRVASSAASATPVARVTVRQYSTTDTTTAIQNGYASAVTATVAGAGILGLADNGSNRSAVGVAVAAAGTGVDSFYLYSDNRTGTATITITVGATVITKTFTFYGSQTTYSRSATDLPLTHIGVGESEAMNIDGKDASGNLTASAGTIYAKSSDTAVATVAVAGSVVTVSGQKSGTATITVCNTVSCTAATKSITIPVAVAKTTAASFTLSFDKSEYTPGEKMTITVKALDSTGLGVADGTRNIFTATGLTSNAALNGASWSAVSGVALVAGVKTYTVYAPLVPGTVSIMATQGAAVDAVIAGGTGAVVSTSATVVSDGVAQAAADAAAEATDAANAATDAANAAAEAADAATAAAQDAADAVAALSTQVAEMIDALKKQITALTNLVIKIQKKVKA
jgi:F0F1-type ATP synthase epsilon subunit